MEDFVLESATTRGEEAPEAPTHDSTSLPPFDKGIDAWLVLAACTVLEALVWGFPFAYGVFQEYYARQEQFSDDKNQLASIGTTATGMMYITAPIVYGVVRTYPRHRRAISLTGFVLMVASLIGASFANTVPQLLATQGVLYALGGSLHYFPAYLYLDEWFVKRRGFAYGIFIAGGGASGIVVPLLMEWILHTWGFRTALRVWVVICVVITTPAMMVLKSHPSGDHPGRVRQRLSFGFLRSPAFWILSVGNVIQSLGYFMPLLYLPSFGVAQGWSPLAGTIAISVCNGASMVGATFVGWLVDRYHVTTAINVCTLGTMFAVFLFWSFAVYQPILYIFAVTYGLFAGGFPATWSGCSNPIRRHYPVETGMIISLFTAGKGIGSLISGPLSGALVASDSWKLRVGFAYGSGYGYLMIFSGITASFAGVGWLGKRLGMADRKLKSYAYSIEETVDIYDFWEEDRRDDGDDAEDGVIGSEDCYHTILNILGKISQNEMRNLSATLELKHLYEEIRS
ncbi:MFS general substrate transporter [Thozetella sp. PMI_491]|nr:MFS general substrate transporter [Thozetella sp. PMI_491]